MKKVLRSVGEWVCLMSLGAGIYGIVPWGGGWQMPSWMTAGGFVVGVPLLAIFAHRKAEKVVVTSVAP